MKVQVKLIVPSTDYEKDFVVDLSEWHGYNQTEIAEMSIHQVRAITAESLNMWLWDAVNRRRDGSYQNE